MTHLVVKMNALTTNSGGMKRHARVAGRKLMSMPRLGDADALTGRPVWAGPRFAHATFGGVDGIHLT